MTPGDRPRTLRQLLTPAALLLGLVLAGYCLFAQFPGMRRNLGMAESQTWFLDSYAVLAACDAERSGLDPFLSNPLDPFKRPHIYSRWWFRLGDLGLTRQDNFLVGGTWVLLFFAAVFALLRPRRFGESAWYAALVLSPPVLLGVFRANNDLVIFALLVAGLLAGAGVNRRPAWFSAALAVATGLKFYPLVAGAALLLVRPTRRMLLIGGLTLLATGLILASVWSDMQRSAIPSPASIHTLGAWVILRDLGWAKGPGNAMTVMVLALLAIVACQRKGIVGLTGGETDLRERMGFAAGATLLLACFVAGISFSYRLIFVLLLAPWLWRQREAFAARLLAGLLLAVLWLDSGFCLFVNLVLRPRSEAAVEQLQRTWHLWTQPWHWLGMGLLAGALLGMALQTWRDSRQVEGSR